jgi:ABC-type Mn2+/Zn2+ transport system ATPase subunit
MAMLLAVARAGNGSRLILLDEADAALDEQNQARVAALLQQLARADDQAGCQILCVTHNAAFQQACDAFVRVAEAAAGSGQRPAVLAAGVAAADTARGAKGAKRSKAVAGGRRRGATTGSKPQRMCFATTK